MKATNTTHLRHRDQIHLACDGFVDVMGVTLIGVEPETAPVVEGVHGPDMVVQIGGQTVCGFKYLSA